MQNILEEREREADKMAEHGAIAVHLDGGSVYGNTKLGSDALFYVDLPRGIRTKHSGLLGFAG